MSTGPLGALLEASRRAGNLFGASSDYLFMDCTQIRFALSARLDDEDMGLPPTVVDRHLEGCVDCRGWAADATEFHRTLRVAPAATEVDRTEAIRAVLAPRPTPFGKEDRTRSLQLVAFFVALVQIVGAIPLLIGNAEEMHGHYARHIGVFTAAMAIGLLFVAWRPARARALLPMLAVLVAGLLWSCLDDLIGGRPVPGSAIAHGFDVAALGVVWLLAHTGAGSEDASKRQPVLR